MAQRVTYRRRLSYNTKSNKVKKVKTPGGRLVIQYIHKRANGPKCGDCGSKLPGVCIMPVGGNQMSMAWTLFWLTMALIVVASFKTR